MCNNRARYNYRSLVLDVLFTNLNEIIEEKKIQIKAIYTLTLRPAVRHLKCKRRSKSRIHKKTELFASDKRSGISRKARIRNVRIYYFQLNSITNLDFNR